MYGLYRSGVEQSAMGKIGKCAMPHGRNPDGRSRWSRFVGWTFAAALSIGPVACTTPVPEAPQLRFVRGGLLTHAGDTAGTQATGGTEAAAKSGGSPLAGDWTFTAREWSPGESVNLAGATGVAPKIAECVQLSTTPLGDVARLVASGGAAPDTDLAFSPDGSRLAVGTYRGEILILNVEDGSVVARSTLGEGMVRRVAWSPDGQTVYAGEQSPDAMLRAFDPNTLKERWSFRFADIVESSALPASEDLYGMYTLPGIYELDVLHDGTLLVSATHGYPNAKGVRQNRSTLIALDPQGSALRRWPPKGALDAIVLHPVLSNDGSTLAIPVSRSADGPDPTDLPIGGMVLLDARDFSRKADMVVAPLKPWFSYAYLWNAHDVDPARDTVMLGFGDGRVVLAGMDGQIRTTLTPGSPVSAGDVPIAASVGHGILYADSAIFLTSGTNIPWGAAAPELRPPSPHPGENTLWSVGIGGEPQWSFHGAWAVQGMTLSDDGRHLVVGAGERMNDQRRDLYGALIFDLLGEQTTGEERLKAVCSTFGPVFFRQAMSRDGVVALTEVPFVDEAGGIAGEYRVVLFR